MMTKVKITHRIDVNYPSPGKRDGLALMKHIENLDEDYDAVIEFLNGMTIEELADCLEWAETVYHSHTTVRSYVQQKLIQMESDIKKLKSKEGG